ncbi:MAG: ribonuclease III [Oscillospiraceae bacterium]|nr:ribonuclease III [Oscillospiraceae bacterium]
MRELEEKIGYRFRDPALLQTALTHSSYANEQRDPACQSYERLEFLGDSILGFTAADFLYAHEPALPEGSMTRLRAELVCEGSLHKVAEELELGKYMRLGRGEEHSGGRERPSILADMVEAVIAALYLDAGLEQARAFILDKVLSGAEISEEHRSGDFKTELQELVQRKADQHIRYELIGESGPDHNKRFTFRVTVNGESVGEGTGRTKKEAEQMAAKQALEILRS